MVTQLQSKITTLLLLPRRAFLSPWGTTSCAQLQQTAVCWFRDSGKENTSHLPQHLGGNNEKVPLIPPESLQMPWPLTSKLKSRATLQLTLLPTQPGLSAAVSDCSAGQGGNVHSFSPESLQGIHYSPLSSYFPSSLIYTRCSST